MPQEGHDKQDGEQGAGTRGLQKHAEAFAPHQGPLLGDDLDSKPPLGALALAKGGNFILVCKPDSPPKLYDRIALWHANDGSATGESRPWNGRCTDVSLYRSLKDVRLLDGQDALSVHWCELTGGNAKTGEQLYHNSFITTHRVTAATVAAVAHAGRGRWKLANENHNVLKTTGYHVEHHFGHGQQSLAAVRLSLNLLAVLFHTVVEWTDDTYALLRRVLARRQTFCDDIRALTCYLVFASGDHLMDFMIRGLELPPQTDTG